MHARKLEFGESSLGADFTFSSVLTLLLMRMKFREIAVKGKMR